MSGLLFFFYLLLVLAALFYLGLWLMRYTTRLGYTPEKRIMFTVAVIACLAFIAYSIGATLNDAPKSSQVAAVSDYQQQPRQSAAQEPLKQEQPAQPARVSGAPVPVGQQEIMVPETRQQYEEKQLQEFERKNYPGLYHQRLALSQDIVELERFFDAIRKLAARTPKQVPLLQKILNTRYDGYQKLKRRNLEVSQHLREFWVHYSTGNTHDAIRKFTPLASRLVKQIKNTQGDVLDGKRKEEKVLSRHMHRAGQYLKSSKIPANLAGRIKSYHSRNRARLMSWLEDRGNHQTTLRVLDDLWNQRILIRDRIKKIQEFKGLYPDLRGKLNRTLVIWNKALESNYYAEFRLLHAAESIYVVEYLDLETGQIPAGRLEKELKSYNERVGKQAERVLDEAEQGYKPPGVR